MAENNQNSETKDMMGNNKTTGGASAKQAKDQSSETNSSTGSASASSTLNNVKETVSAAATEVVGQAKEKAGTVLDEQKTTLASGITSVADSIRHVGENLGSSQENNQVAALAGKYSDTLAQQVEKLSSYIDEREFKELKRDVEQFARRNPLLFVGTAFTLGILAARFLKSSSSQTSGKRSAGKISGSTSGSSD